MKQIKKTRLFSLLFSLALFISLLCGMSFNAHAESAAHSHDSVEFETVLTSDGGTLTSGNYYLTENVTLTNNITIPGDATVNICLNGYVLKGVSGGYYGSTIMNYGTLNIYDCNSDDQTHYFTDGDYGTWVWDTEENSSDAHAVTGGCITGGTGRIRGNVTNAHYGGGIYSEGDVTLNGGYVVGNKACRGAGVYILGKTLTINDGGILGNHAYYEAGLSSSSGQGGGIATFAGGSIVMNGGCISYNSTLNASPDRYKGGGVYTDCSFIMTGGTISYNYSKRGGGVYNNGTFTMTGGTISNCEAYSGAGLFTCGTSNISNSTFKNNTSYSWGGGINNELGTNYLTIDHTTFTGNNALIDGGAISNGSILTLTNNTITGNTASRYAGAVYNVGTAYLGGSLVITDNTANGQVDNFYMYPNSVIILGTGASGNGVEVPVTEGASAMKIGITSETVPVSGTPVAITTENNVVTGNDYSSCFISDNSDYIIAYDNTDRLMLELPDEPVPQYKITTDGTVTTDVSEALPGDTVTMTAQLNKYYIVDKYYVNGVAQTGNTFVMPSRNVTVSATVLYTIPKPMGDVRTYYYTGKEYQFYPLYYNSYTKEYFSANGYYYDVYNDKRTEPGTQTVTVKLKDGYAWNDGSTEDLTFDFTVKKGTQQNAFVYFLKDLAKDRIVIGFDDGSYIYDRDFDSMQYVFAHYAPNIYNVRDNAEVTYEYYSSNSSSYAWDDLTNKFSYQGLGSITETYHTSKWRPEDIESVAESKAAGAGSTYDYIKNLYKKQLLENYEWFYARDNGIRYITIHIAETDHYEGCTIRTSGNYGKYKITQSCAQVDAYALEAYMDVNNGLHWDYGNDVLNWLGKDDPVRESVNLLTVLSTSFEARNAYYSFISGNDSDYAHKVSTRNFSDFDSAVDYASEEQNYGAAAEDITLSNGQIFRLSRKGYIVRSSVSAASYGTNASEEETEVIDTTEETDHTLDSLDLEKLTDITEIMSDEIVGDELLEGEVSPEEVEQTVEVEGLEDLDQAESDTHDIELEESYVINAGQVINLDLGDCDIDITGMQDMPVYEVKAGGALIIRSSNGGKIVSSDEISKFVKVDEGGMLIVYGSDILPESAIENNGYRLYPVITDATYNDGQEGTVDFQYRVVGDKVKEPEDPEREGYVFGGWYKDEALTEKWDFDNDTITEDDLADGLFVLYARWIKKCEGDHDFVSEVTIPATCTTDGFRTYTCTHEDYSYTEVIPATGHDFTDYVSNNDATCTEDGTKTAICNNGCGETDTIVDEGTALGHDYQPEVTKEPTTDEDGVRTYTCTRCEDSYTEAIPALKITQQPENYFGAFHSWGQFQVTAQGEGLTYRWYFSRNGRIWTHVNLGWEENATYRVPITFSTNMLSFRCEIRDAYGNVVVSDPVYLVTDAKKTAERLWDIFSEWGNVG